MLRYARISPYKMRLVVNLIRGKGVNEALAILQFTPKKGARLLLKLLRSAIANASQNREVEEDKLYVEKVYVDEGPTWKRIRPRAMGRANLIRKRTSHITLILGERK